uniref:Uncharacterized protein n=1 Tax=Ditylenchus dipsaci TaxID=166011 RepID=A0A915D5L0_9BILA
MLKSTYPKSEWMMGIWITRSSRKSGVSSGIQHGKPKPVQIEYSRKFGRHARTPDGATIKRWWTKIFGTGSVNKRKETKTSMFLTKCRKK